MKVMELRKFQKEPVALLGGTILINILTVLFLDYILGKNVIFDNFIQTNREFFVFIVGLISFYLFWFI